MGGSGSSSSSSSSKKKKKKDKSKKDKTAKKQKKNKKDDKKQKKRIEQAKNWFCDRLDAVRYIRQMLEIDPGVGSELDGLFETIDEGEVVRIDGLEDKQVKKKLRHLFQALKLTPVGESGFKSSDRKVAFAAVFKECLQRANEKNAAEAKPSAASEVHVLDVEPEISPPRDACDAAANECGEEIPAPSEEVESQRKAKRPRVKGPQLPMPGIGAVEDSEDEKSSSDGDAGPKLAGEERAGVDLNSLPAVRKRAGWMTEAHGSLGGIFGDAPVKTDSFEVRRSKADEEAFEKMMQKRGSSLLQEAREGKFTGSDSKSLVDEMHRKLASAQEAWGMSEKEQVRKSQTATMPQSERKAFNPEEDLARRKPMTGADFSKFVDQSVGDLSGRFSRSQVATSFL